MKHLYGNRNDVVKSLTELQDNSIVVVGDFQSNSLTVDSSQILNFENTNTNDGFISKFNKNGQLIWIKQILGSGNNLVYKVISDKESNIYVIGTAAGIIQFDSNSLVPKYTNQTRIFILKLDSNGSLLKKQEFQSPNLAGIFPGALEVDQQQNVVFTILNTRNDSIYFNGGDLPKSGNTSRLIKLNANLQFLWSIIFNQNNYSITDIKSDLYQNYYMSGTYNESISIGNTSLTSCNGSNNNSYLCKISDNGLIKWLKCQGTTTFIGGNINPKLAVYENAIYLAGTYKGQLKIDSNTNLSATPDFTNLFIAKFNQDGNLVWVKKGLSGNNNSNNVKSIKIYKKENIFILSQHVGGDFIFDQVQTKSLPGNNSYGLIQKIDGFGNVLFGFEISSTNTGLNEIAIDKNGNSYFGGMFGGNLTLLNFNLYSSGSNDGFFAKIGNYNIFHENIPNLICGKDSFEIPYTSYGKFKSDNKFTLELSDTTGSFLSNSNKIVGFTLDSVSGTIKAVIPDSILPSKKYKFRIISSNPIVISDFDTNFYSIQNLPKASAGIDTTVCFGQEFIIGSNQSSANSFSWNLGLYLKDSTLKQPLTKRFSPAGAQLFILKAANEHCAAFDSVLVNFSPPLNIYVSKDTSICQQDSFTISPVLLGGKARNSKTLFWYANTFDSLTLVAPILSTKLSSNQRYFLILSDGCSLPDTSETDLQIIKAIKTSLPKDTNICIGQSIRLVPENFYQDTQGFSFVWTDSLFNLISTADSILLNPLSSQRNYLISKHICAEMLDTSSIFISVNKPLQMEIYSDSLICSSDTLTVKILLTGGKPRNYLAGWNIGNIDSSEKFLFNPTILQYEYYLKQVIYASQTLFVKISDNCSVPINDSVSIRVHLPLRFEVNHNQTCLGLPSSISILATSGKSPFNFLWQTIPNRNTISDNDSLFLLSASDTSFFIIVQDDCKQRDSLFYEAKFYPNPIASFDIRSINYYANETEVAFTNQSFSQNPSKYFWQFENGLTSTLESPIIGFTSPGIKQIFMQVTNQFGCLDSTAIDTFITVNNDNGVFLPNAIHLSGTGLNEVFKPIGLNILSYQLQIFNRWGILVFNNNQTSEGFKGKDQSGNDLAAGVYFYLLSVETILKEKIKKSGALTVIR
ncbi:MAG: gliding motility-associated C-terminal domain-containing protein [bacterium]|nr:gliding motility-associated C-terminal domain-containing protein [bacterium]